MFSVIYQFSLNPHSFLLDIALFFINVLLVRLITVYTKEQNTVYEK